MRGDQRAQASAQVERAYLTHQQVKQLATAGGEVGGPVVRVLAYTGLRWGELAGLTVASVDVLRRRLQISQAVAEADGRLVWKSPKDHERRSVPLPAFLADELGKQMLGKGRDDLLFSASRAGRSGSRTGDRACSTLPATR